MFASVLKLYSTCAFITDAFTQHIRTCNDGVPETAFRQITTCRLFECVCFIVYANKHLP